MVFLAEAAEPHVKYPALLPCLSRQVTVHCIRRLCAISEHRIVGVLERQHLQMFRMISTIEFWRLPLFYKGSRGVRTKNLTRHVRLPNPSRPWSDSAAGPNPPESALHAGFPAEREEYERSEFPDQRSGASAE